MALAAVPTPDSAITLLDHLVGEMPQRIGLCRVRPPQPQHNKFLECPEIVVSSSRCHRPQMSFFADSFRGDPHGTDPKFVRITEVFSLQFFGGTGGTGGTPRDLMLQRWYQPVGPVGPVFANFVFHGQSVVVVPPVPPISTTIISIMRLQYHRYHRYHRNACHKARERC